MAEQSSREGTSGRTAVVVLGIILGVVIGANLANAALPPPASPGSLDAGPALPADPGSSGTGPSLEPGPVAAGEGIDLGGGFAVVAPPGWTAVGTDTGIVLQKGGVLVIAAGFPWEATPDELARAYRDQWFAGGEFTGDDPHSGSLGAAIPAAGMSYTGIWNGSHVDGAIVAGALDGDGVIVNVVGPAGALAGVGNDLDAMLGSIRHGGG